MRQLLAIFVLLTLPAFAQTKHPFTFEDMMSLKRVGEPVPSPDGKWVLFSAVDVNLATNTKTPHVWVVPIAGGQEREIIANQDADRPRWAPDGRRFAFLSTKEGGSQIWIADFDGAVGAVTGVRKLTSIATEAGGEVWSPDGKNILFTSDVYPECDGAPAEGSACNATKVEAVEKSKVKAQIFIGLLYRHWNAYKQGKRSHIFILPVLPIGAVIAGQIPVSDPPRDLTPGDFDSPVFSLGGQDNYAFSPDGQEICYTSNHDKVEATSTNNDLWIVPVNGGGRASSPVPPRNITAENKASDSTPLYSPDGKYIAYRSQKRPGYESDTFQLTLYGRKTGRKTPFTPVSKTDFWVGSFVWASNSSGFYFVAEDKGEAPIFFVSFTISDLDPAGGDVSIHSSDLQYTEISRGYNDDLGITNDGKLLLFTRMSVQSPNVIYKFPLPDPGLKTQPLLGKEGPISHPEQKLIALKAEPLTHLNDPVLSQVAMPPLEPFWFTGAENVKVQGFLVKPPNFDPKQKYPVKFLIHGGPQGAWGDDWSYRWNPELFAANGYVVVMVNPRGSTGYGQKFIDDINGDWGGRAFEDLMKGLDYAEQNYPFIDKDRECALGASFGGYMVNWILGHTNRFKCLVSHDGMFNTDSAWGTTEELWFNEWEFKGTPYTNREMYRKWSPHLSATNFKTPTLVVHSQLDYRLDVSEGFQLFTTLQRMNVPSKMLYFPDEGHWISKPQNAQLWYKTVNDWVDQWLKK